jgi:hypothetical protein
MSKRKKLSKTLKNDGLGGAGSVRRGAVLPTRNRLPKINNNSASSKIGIPSIAQPSRKDPIKSIQQTQNKDIKDIKMKEALSHIGEVVKTLPNGQWSLEKADKAIVRKPGEAKGSTSSERADAKERDSQKEMEQKLQDPSFKNAALVSNKKDIDDKKQVEVNYDKAVETVDPDAKPAVATKKRKATYIAQFNRRKEAPDAKLIDKESKGELKRSLEESLETLEKINERIQLVEEKLIKKSRCWEGYEPVPGKKAYDKGSCRPMSKKECECEDCDCNKNMAKSGYKGYTEEDNIKRKANNVTAEESPIQSMRRVKKYGKRGANELGDTVRELKAKSKKQPVKVYTKEELDIINSEKKAA